MGKAQISWFSGVGTGLLCTVALLFIGSIPTNASEEPSPIRTPRASRISDNSITLIKKLKAGSRSVTLADNEASSTSMSLPPGNTCAGDLSGVPTWIISGWVIGEEIYNAYQDPELVCPGAYPFAITEAHILLQINPDPSLLPLDIPLTVDIELVDTLTEPGCPRPGAQVSLGSQTVVTIPGAGIWDIAIPLDFPVEVTGPYFVGLTFDSLVTPLMGISLITDGIETLCVSYNKWDESIGFVDLGNDSVVYTHAYPPSHACFSAEPNDPDCFSFDGRLVMWTVGVTGNLGCCNIAGDANNDDLVNIADITFLIARIFAGGQAPFCSDEADANGDNTVNVGDVTYLIARIFAGGTAPDCGATGS